MKIRVIYEAVFDSNTYFTSKDYNGCTYDEFKESLSMDFQNYPEDVVENMSFEEIKE